MRDYDHHLFYSSNIADNDMITLDESETRHAVSVLRLNVGEQIQVTNGSGTIYDCQCVDIGKRSMTCQIQSKKNIPRLSPELTLLAGLPDKEHFETILEHVTALGVARVVPLVMENSRKPWWGSWEKSRERFVSKMIVSMKQCLYPYIPQLDAPASLGDTIDTCEKPIVAADQHGKNLCGGDLPQHGKLTCLVGPPGGISASERALLESRGSLTVKIAPTRLRTELAATVICSRIMAL